MGYFPSIDLYFTLNSTVIDNIKSAEWNHTEGTKNKSITVTATSGIDPSAYVCVATGLPGPTTGYDEAFIFIRTQPSEIPTFPMSTELPPSRNDRPIGKSTLLNNATECFRKEKIN